MINVRFMNNAVRKNIVTTVDKTINDFITENGFSLAGATPIINGRVVADHELSQTFEQLGIQDGSEPTVSAIKKVTNA